MFYVQKMPIQRFVAWGKIRFQWASGTGGKCWSGSWTMNVHGRYNAICSVFVGQTVRQPRWCQSIELWSGGALISACLLNQLSCRLDFRTEWCDPCVVMLKVAGRWPFPGAQRPLGPPYFQFHLSVNKTREWAWESKGHIVNLPPCVCVCACLRVGWQVCVCRALSAERPISPGCFQDRHFTIQ